MNRGTDVEPANRSKGCPILGEQVKFHYFSTEGVVLCISLSRRWSFQYLSARLAARGRHRAKNVPDLHHHCQEVTHKVGKKKKDSNRVRFLLYSLKETTEEEEENRRICITSFFFFFCLFSEWITNGRSGRVLLSKAICCIMHLRFLISSDTTSQPRIK